MIGRVSPKGAALRYAESGTPCCSFVLEVDEVTQGKTYTTYIPCEITGKYAEDTSVTIEPGDVLQISGKWKYKSTVDQKTGAKVSKPVVSSWGISQREPAPSESPQERAEDLTPASVMSEGAIVDSGGDRAIS
jgi:single-stranded DNA-binding protein